MPPVDAATCGGERWDDVFFGGRFLEGQRTARLPRVQWDQDQQNRIGLVLMTSPMICGGLVQQQLPLLPPKPPSFHHFCGCRVGGSRQRGIFQPKTHLHCSSNSYHQHCCSDSRHAHHQPQVSLLDGHFVALALLGLRRPLFSRFQHWHHPLALDDEMCRWCACFYFSGDWYHVTKLIS